MQASQRVRRVGSGSRQGLSRWKLDLCRLEAGMTAHVIGFSSAISALRIARHGALMQSGVYAAVAAIRLVGSGATSSDRQRKVVERGLDSDPVSLDHLPQRAMQVGRWC